MVFSKFDALSARPPTPPKELPTLPYDETLNFLDDPFGDKDAALPPPHPSAQHHLLSTPQPSPPSDLSIPSSAASRQKRVNFELQTCAAPPSKALAQSWTPTHSSPLRPLPQTRVSRPLKSILKPSDATATPPPADQTAVAHRFKTFAEMLESVVKLLASPERPSRMDAYHCLHRTLQAYDKLPDDQALKQKMSLLTHFIERDIQAPSPTGNGLDSQMITQALKLLMALFRIADAAAAMNDEFCSFVVERTIHVATDASMPKVVVNTHLAALMQQNFRPKIMTVARTEKVLDALDSITDRVGGYSVQAYRIRIYRKLIQQRPDVMVKHTERWFKHTVKGLMAGQKDINQSALDIALSAAKTIGHDQQVARLCLTVLNRISRDGQTVAGIMAEELEKMLTGDNAALVPQIWSAVTVLLRDSLHGNMFTAMKEWLRVFEKCFKSAKETVRIQTNVAFCFLLYAVNLTHATTEGWTKMFIEMMLHQFQRRFPAKKVERDAVSSAYLTLLYYAFRPTAPHDQLDRFWQDFVTSFWAPLISSPSSPHALAACRIVSALLNGSRKPWNEQRVLDHKPQSMLKQSELPLLDPKWVRKSIPLILQFFEKLWNATLLHDARPEDEPVKTVWLALLNSLVEAGSKEVMASSESKDALAHIVNFLRRVWMGHTGELAIQQQEEDIWAGKFCFLLETVVQKLGASQLAEKSLTRNGADEIEVAPTPSHRARNQAPRISPLLYLVDLLANQSEGKLADPVRLRAIKLVLEPCLHAQNTRLAKIEMLRDCAAIATTTLPASLPPDFWALIATLLGSTLQDQTTDLVTGSTASIGKEYSLVAEILALRIPYFLTTTKGHSVLSVFTDTVRTEGGESAVTLAVIEKISECVLNKLPDEDMHLGLKYTSMLLQNLPKQTTRRALEQSRQILWPSSSATARHADFDPYIHFPVAVVNVGSAAYRNLRTDDIDGVKEFLAALATSIKSCTTSHLAIFLRKNQTVIKMWVEDPQRKLQSNQTAVKDVFREVVNLWGEVNNALERLPRKDSQILVHLEPLITAGFTSKRKSIVNSSVVVWNATFGKQESLRYPSILEQALRRLCRNVDLLLPSLDIQEDKEGDEVLFYESDSSDGHIQRVTRSAHIKESRYRVRKTVNRSATRSPAASSPRRTIAHPQPERKVRLRHDNSQTEFEPILSSPSNPFNQESQILTERQRETIERQRLTGGLFANLGAASPRHMLPASPCEIHSDPFTGDELPTQGSCATPLEKVAAMGALTSFLGSSPTPNARRSVRNMAQEGDELLSTASLNVAQGPHKVSPRSSPQRSLVPEGGRLTADNFDSSLETSAPDLLLDNAEDQAYVADRLEDGIKEQEDGEELPCIPGVARPISNTQSDENSSVHSGTPELRSSSIDLQLDAQLDADIQAHAALITDNTLDKPMNMTTPTEDSSKNTAVHTSHEEQNRSDFEMEDSQLSFMAKVNVQKKRQKDPYCTKGSQDASRPQQHAPDSQPLRRSLRHSAISSPAHTTSPKEQQSTPSKTSTNAAQEQSAKRAETQTAMLSSVKTPSTELDGNGVIDNIVVASPASSHKRGRKRKSADAASFTNNQPTPSKVDRKRGPIRRSQSMLSQIENSQNMDIEDDPRAKRARHSADHDVSAAREDSIASSQSKRLHHVQVTTKRTPASGSPIGRYESSSKEQASETQILTIQNVTVHSESQAAPTTGVATPSRSFTERVILTPRSIINQLKSLKDYLFSTPQLVLARDEEREIDDTLFDIRRQVHAAGIRGDKQQGSGS